MTPENIFKMVVVGLTVIAGAATWIWCKGVDQGRRLQCKEHEDETRRQKQRDWRRKERELEEAEKQQLTSVGGWYPLSEDEIEVMEREADRKRRDWLWEMVDGG